MRTPSLNWVRTAFVGVGVLLGVGFLLPPAHSQVTRPGMPGGIPRPPTPPSFPGNPGVPGRPGGGITGMPGNPGGIAGNPGGIPGGGFPGGGFGGGATESVWTCSGCNAELGRGPVKPSYTSCPRCGAKFSNGGPGFGGGGLGGGGVPPPTFTTPPSFGDTEPIDLQPRNNPGPSANPGPKTSPRPSTPNNPSNQPRNNTSSSPAKAPEPDHPAAGVLLILIYVNLGVLALLAGLGGIVLIAAHASRAGARENQLKGKDDDDDD